MEITKRIYYVTEISKDSVVSLGVPYVRLRIQDINGPRQVKLY